MTSRLLALSFDANDPLGLSRFWADALGWQVAREIDDGAHLVPTEGTTFRIVFRPTDERKTAKNPIHLDLTTSSIDDQTEMVERLVRLGAQHIDVGQGPSDKHVVLADPEGNEFCVIEPENKFLAGRGRLGSITCDGSPEVGHFWSAALGWPLFWDQDEETAIRTPDGTGPFITWGPPVPTNVARNRLHFDIAPLVRGNQQAELDRLVTLGAAVIDGLRMADPDGNEFWMLGADQP
jgi:catechol 2,3-dioxygenase-like lactoylglutathione lyase family enzyme